MFLISVLRIYQHTVKCISVRFVHIHLLQKDEIWSCCLDLFQHIKQQCVNTPLKALDFTVHHFNIIGRHEKDVLGTISRFCFSQNKHNFNNGFRFCMTVRGAQNARTPEQLLDQSCNPPGTISSLWCWLEPHAPKENACNWQLKDLHIAGFFSSALPPPVAINYWLAFTLTCKSDKT